MDRRGCLVAVGVLLLTLLGWFVVDELVGPRWELWFAPELTRAADALNAKARIVVGKNFHISAARPSLVHQGCTIAADSSMPPRLFAASMITPQKRLQGIVGYFSHDGGLTWQLGIEQTGRNADDVSCDEAVTFGPEAELFLAYMRGPFKNLKPGRESEAETVFLVSGDGGKTWSERTAIKGLVDRPQITFDSTSGPHRGRLYCNANFLAAGHNVAAVWASADGAKTMTPSSMPARKLLTVYNSNPVVLADGTVIVAYNLLGSSATASPRFAVLRSTDGGKSFAAAASVRTVWRHPHARSSSGLTLYPRLAADSTGRLFCVWSDGPFVIFSWSADRGTTWSEPMLLSEQLLAPGGKENYDASMPAIAVNKAGQVAVLWYDRRGLPAPKEEASDAGGKRVVMEGYNLRLRASLDGGLSWLGSIQVNEAAGQGDPVQARHWVGMAASADGRFHPAWISDSSGTLQIWTAAVSIENPQ
jgi:hypothetical protein